MSGERWVIFAAGAWCAPSTIKRFLSGSTKTIACDGSLTKCFTEGFEPMWVIGDMDSVTPEALAKFQEKGGEVIKRPDQDRHDLAKALAYARENGASSCFIFGATGGDEQHTWANLLTCAASAMDVTCIGPEQVYRFFKPGTPYSIELIPEVTFSLFALPQAEGICLSGSTYTLNDARMVMGSQGLHNQCATGRLNLSYAEGRLMMMHPHPFVSEEDVNEA